MTYLTNCAISVVLRYIIDKYTATFK